MKKFTKLTALLLAVLMLFSLAACGGGTPATNDTPTTQDNNPTDQDTSTDSEDSEVQYDEVIINVANSVTEDHPVSAGHLKFEELVEERSNGAVQVEIFFNGTFGSGLQIVEAVQSGSVQAGESSLSSLATLVPEVQYTGLPFSFDSRDHAFAWTETEFANQIKDKILEKSGCYLLAWLENGIRKLSNSKHPVTCPDDMQGLKIRVMDSPIYIEMFTEMGASPTPMSLTEVYTALQQGTVDGQDNPYSTFVSTKFYEIQKYFTNLDHTFDFTGFIISNDFLQSLNEATRELIIECGKEAQQASYDYAVESEARLIQTVEDSGMEIYTLSDEERELFKESVSGMEAWFEQNVASDLNMEDFKASLEESRPA